MHKVTVAVDESAKSFRGLGVGQALAEQLAVPLSLYSVVPDDSQKRDRRYDIEQALTATHGDDVRPALELVAANSVVSHLIGLLQSNQDLLLCMATHARGALAETLLGSVASGVVKGAGRPVVLAGPALDERWRAPVQTLVTCLDGSELSEAVLPHAVRLAKLLKAELCLVRATNPEDLTTYAPGGVEEAEYLRQLAARLRQEQQIEVRWNVAQGDAPELALCEYSRQLPGAMMIMTTHGRSGLQLSVVGSMAHRLVRNATCPVAVMRPTP